MYLTLHRDVDPAPGVIVELSTTYIMPVYESEGIIRSMDLRRLMSPKRESSKREYCVPHHRACLHEQESQLNLLTCTLNSFLVIHLGQLLRSIFSASCTPHLRHGRHHTYNPSLTSVPT